MLLCGMPPRKKPHPRSLDALFPRPRTVPRKAVKLCPANHRQGARWRTGDPCVKCDQVMAAVERELKRAASAKAEKDGWRRRLGPPPAEMQIRETSTGRLIRFLIPSGARRGPRPTRRI